MYSELAGTVGRAGPDYNQPSANRGISRLTTPPPRQKKVSCLATFRTPTEDKSPHDHPSMNGFSRPIMLCRISSCCLRASEECQDKLRSSPTRCRTRQYRITVSLLRHVHYWQVKLLQSSLHVPWLCSSLHVPWLCS